MNSNVDKKTESDEIPVRLCNYVDVYKHDFIDAEMPFMKASATAAEVAKFRLRKDDVIITKDSEDRLDIGVPALVSSSAEDLVCGYHLSILRPHFQRARGDFIFWALQARQVRDAFSNSAYGITRYGLSLGGTKDIKIDLPEVDAQKSIAEYLGRETARIDELIEKKQRLVELAGEKRAALINAAVTGQINPQTGHRIGSKRGPGKTRLRHVAAIMNSNVDKKTESDEIPVRLCNYVDVYKHDFIDAEMPFMKASATAAEVAKFRLRKDDVIITKDSEDRLDIGVPALVSSSAEDLVCGYHLSILRPHFQRARGDFIFWALQARQVRDAFSNSAYGITRYGLSLGGTKDIKIDLPEVDAQKSIAEYLGRETARIDVLRTKTSESIDRLREFRAALVTAAVTGQIDVAT